MNNNETDNNFIGLGSSFIGSLTIKLGKFYDIKTVFIVVYEYCLNNTATVTLAKRFVEYKLYKLMTLYSFHAISTFLLIQNVILNSNCLFNYNF